MKDKTIYTSAQCPECDSTDLVVVSECLRFYELRVSNHQAYYDSGEINEKPRYKYEVATCDDCGHEFRIIARCYTYPNALAETYLKWSIPKKECDD